MLPFYYSYSVLPISFSAFFNSFAFLSFCCFFFYSFLRFFSGYIFLFFFNFFFQSLAVNVPLYCLLFVSPLFISFSFCFQIHLLFFSIFFFSNSALLNIVHQIFNFSSIFKRFSLQLIPQYVKCCFLM